MCGKISLPSVSKMAQPRDSRRLNHKVHFYEYAIAGTLHMKHLAGLSCSQADQAPLDRQIFQLSRTLELSEQETQKKLQRVLTQHRSEWDAFVTSLGTQSFVSQWALEAPRNVLG